MNRNYALTLIALASFIVGTAAAETFYWAASPAKYSWGDWDEVSNWKIGGTAGAAATRLPSASDAIYYPQTNLWANLGGASWEISAYDQDSAPRLGPTNLGLTNGTLTVKKSYEVYSGEYELFDGATLIIAPTISKMYESCNNASYVTWKLHSGSRMEIMPQELRYFQGYYTVEAGATLNISPVKFRWSNNSPWPNYYQNRGTMIITNGCDFTGSTESPDQTQTTNWKTKPFRPRDGWVSYLAFDQLGGTTRLGGSFNNAGLGGVGYFFSVGGGTLEVVSDTSFIGFSCAVSNNAAVTVNVAAGATMDMSTFTYGTGAAITKTGEGTLFIGENQPDSLTVSAGKLAFTCSPDVSKITLAEGTTLVFAGSGITLNDLANYTDFHFAVDLKRVPSSSRFFASSNATMLEYVRSEVAAALGSAYDVVASNGGLYYLEYSDNVFDMTSGRGLDDAEGWIGKQVPADADVVLRGVGKVTLGPSSPKFSAITLELGAELETTGGTEQAPVVLPPVTINISGTLRVGGESYAVITNGLSANATAESLPVFEIATNAVAFMHDPAFPARDLYFKNLDVRLYGRLRVPDTSATGGSRMYFGYANSGETTYMAFTADGGSIHARHTAAAYMGNFSLVAIACPASGGRVKVMRDVVFRDYRKICNLNDPDDPYGNTANSGYHFGVNNPTDECFNVVVDNCLVSPAGPTKIAGGAHLKFVNGGRFERPYYTGMNNNNHSYGHTRGVWIQDSGSMTFEGGKFFLDHPCGTSDLGKGLAVNSGSAGFASLVLGGGVKFTLWEQYGNGKGVCTVTDGTFYVPRLHPPRMEALEKNDYAWTVMTTWTQTNTPAFNGFASVNIPSGGVLRFDASDEIYLSSCGENKANKYGVYSPYSSNDVWYRQFWEWDRTTALTVPVTGAGDIVVTNSLSGTDSRQGAWYHDASWGDFPDLSYWSMNLVLRGTDNTCSGRIGAETNAKAYLHLADGAVWAGTLAANDHVRFGDPIAEREGAAVAPARVSVGAVVFTGAMPVRLWKSGDTKANDFLEIAGDSTGTARNVGLSGVGMGGYEPLPGEYFTVARCPKTATAPKAARGWKVKIVDDPDNADKVLVQLANCPAGTQILLR